MKTEEIAVLNPLDHLFTHFPLEEKPESDAGRFGEEAMRLGKIFEEITRHSLLLNESLSSTSLSESLYLAQDIVRMLRPCDLLDPFARAGRPGR